MLISKGAMIFTDISTWPDVLVAHLNATTENEVCTPDPRYIDNLLDAVTLLGYHCTRLTPDEALHIRNHGMQLPTRATLEERIRNVCRPGSVLEPYMERLLNEHERVPGCEMQRLGLKNDELWFFFYGPAVEAPFLYERFFRYWGGECVYRPFEEDPIGRLLETIGTPCIIEADVPIVSMDSHNRRTLRQRLIDRFMVRRNVRTRDQVEEIDHTGAICRPLPAANVRRIIPF